MPLRISLPTAIIPGPKKKKLFLLQRAKEAKEENPAALVPESRIFADKRRIVLHGGDARNLPPLPERADIDQLAAAAHKHGRAMPGQAAEQILGIDRFTRNRAA